MKKSKSLCMSAAFVYGSLFSTHAISQYFVCDYLSGDQPIHAFSLAEFETSSEALTIVNKITASAGLSPNFEVVENNRLNNAAAYVVEGSKGLERYIGYNNMFISQLEKATNTEWAAISVLAHEVGHHLNGHTILKGGSRPDIELEAGHYSGLIVQKLGGSLKQATAAMRYLASDSDSRTHPSKQKRITAITLDWNRSCATDKTCKSAGDAALGHDLATKGEALYLGGQTLNAKRLFLEASKHNNSHA